MYESVYKGNFVPGHNSQMLIIGSLKKKKKSLLNWLSFVKQRMVCLQVTNHLNHGCKVNCNGPKLIYSGKIKFYSLGGSVLSISNWLGKISDF